MNRRGHRHGLLFPSAAPAPPSDARRLRGWLLPGCLFFCGLIAHAQFPQADQNSARSFSGQFFVSRAEAPAPAGANLAWAGTNFIQLNPAMLAVGAERFKSSLWRQLGYPADTAWTGKIFLRLQPAHSDNDTVNITASPFLDRWAYRVDLPEQLSKTRLARALSGVLLLELANRQTPRGGRCAEVPPWLVDGLAQQILAIDGDQALISTPTKKDEPLAVSRLELTQRGWDPLAAARRVLQDAHPLTFDELSWPSDAQMAGRDDGVYYASAQLFTAELLSLKGGPEKMRALLAELPRHLNWQMAFFRAFQADFKRPLEVEKWWALRTVIFAEEAPGPHWKTDVSIARLQELLCVPVEFRGESNALPARADISLQAAIQSMAPAQRDQLIETKVRDLALAELRLAPPFGGLADAYRLTLADFLGDVRRSRVSVVNKHGSAPTARTSVDEAIKQLNALDVRRRYAEVRVLAVLPGQPAPGTSARSGPGPQPF